MDGSFQLVSAAFAEGETIPAIHTLEGLNLSPPLRWSGEPEATRSYALVLDDPDASQGTWLHWVLFNIPAALHALPVRVERAPELANGARHGRCWGTSRFERIGYQGPQPPAGERHRYRFVLRALDRQLDLVPGCSIDDLISAMDGHELAQACLKGRYPQRGREPEKTRSQVAGPQLPLASGHRPRQDAPAPPANRQR